jgi:hypothetical protein
MDFVKEKLPAYSVVLSYIFQIVCNAVVGNQIGEVSRKNDTNLTPDGLTFIIWAFIYVFQLVLVVYQTFSTFPEKYINRWVLNTSFILNGLWCIFWVNEFWISQFIIITLYLICLIVVYYQTVDTYDIYIDTVLINFGISSNLIWVCFATVISLTITLKNYKVEAVSDDDWATIWLICLTIINNMLVFIKNDYVIGLVSIWAISGIYRNQNDLISSYALVCLIVIFIITLCSFTMIIVNYKKQKNSKFYHTLNY